MITVRTGTLEDLKTVQQLNLQLFEYEMNNKLHDAYNPEWSFAKEGEAYFKNRLMQEDGGVAFVAEDDGKVIGYLAAKYATHSFRSENPIAEIENIYVEETHRRKNIGTLLYEEFKKWCIKNEVKRMKVTAAYPNSAAREFYESLGFGSTSVTFEQKLS